MPKFNRNFNPEKTIFPFDETIVENNIADNTVKVTVTAEKLNVRKGPGVNSEIVDVIDYGTKLTGTFEGDWFKISDEKYVMSKFVTK